MNRHQEVRIRDLDGRRRVASEWLPGAVARILDAGALERRLANRVPVPRDDVEYRVWSDGTVSMDVALPAEGPLAAGTRRDDLLGPVSGDHDMSVDAWRTLTQWTPDARGSRPGLLPHREPGDAGLSGFTYWRGDFETCVLVRMAVAEYLAAVHAIERDEAMIELEGLRDGANALAAELDEARAKLTATRRSLKRLRDSRAIGEFGA